VWRRRVCKCVLVWLGFVLVVCSVGVPWFVGVLVSHGGGGGGCWVRLAGVRVRWKGGGRGVCGAWAWLARGETVVL